MKQLLLLSAVLLAGQLSSDGGRYVFGQVSEFRRDQYLLDTKTGMMWSPVMCSDSIERLQPVKFISGYKYDAETETLKYITSIKPDTVNKKDTTR